MASECPHENTRNVLDMPMADPDTFDFLGRFDVLICVDCELVLSKSPTQIAPPSEPTVGNGL